MKRMLKKSGVAVGIGCAALVMLLSACDRGNNMGGTGENSLERTRDNTVVNTNDPRSLGDQMRDNTRNAAKDVGRGLDRTGKDIQDASTNQ